MKRFAGLLSIAALVCTVGCGQTDAGIATAVKTKLAANDLVKASDINVDTRDYIVTLATGDVGTAVAKEEAVRVARGTDGVRDVIDRLTLRDTPIAATSGRADDVEKNLSRRVRMRRAMASRRAPTRPRTVSTRVPMRPPTASRRAPMRPSTVSRKAPTPRWRATRRSSAR